MPNSVRNSLEVALQANAAAYRRAVQASAPGDCWDFLVLTAANEKQAQGYRQELAMHERAVGPTGAFFPAIQRSLVVPDPPGRRAGSGGATLGALRALCDQFHLKPDDVTRLRILLIHSGGASQRLPAYSPLGKIFAPLPLLRPDGQIATLFDHLYLTLAGLPERLGPGMLVMAGDVFLLFDHRHVSAPPPGVTALSMRVDAELGRGHGVFVTDSRGRITRTLQKVSVDRMRKAGAADDAGRVLIDTGLLFFDGQRTQMLAAMSGCAGGRRRPGRGLHERYSGQIDLYEDVTGALARGTNETQFLAERETRPMRRELWRTFRGIPFLAAQLDGQFLHLGTTRQFRDAMIGRNPSPAAELFQRNVLAHGNWGSAEGRRVYHSILRPHVAQPPSAVFCVAQPPSAVFERSSKSSASGGTQPRAAVPQEEKTAKAESTTCIGDGSVIEHSMLCEGCRIGQGSVISQVVALSRPIIVPDDLLLLQAPVQSPEAKLLFAQVVCGVEDDFKGRYSDGKCVYFNRPIEEWLSRFGITAHEVWKDLPGEQRTLWNARLFVATKDRDAAHVALPLASIRTNGSAINTWRRLPRYSMAMILEQADPAELIAHREVVSAALQTAELIDVIRRREDRPMDLIIGRYATLPAYAQAERLLDEFASVAPGDDAEVAIDQARAMWSAAQLAQRPDHAGGTAARHRIEAFMQTAFAKVAQASEIGHRRIEAAPSPTTLSPGLEVTATCPVRLDLAGGWSDTPPYCFERGGQVVNVAIDLDGRPPVRASVRTISDPKLILESHDLGRTLELTDLPASTNGTDVRDPFALHKVALGLAGLLPPLHTTLRAHLTALGAGLHVVTESRVPKGSGLGTSSILAAALLAALHKLCGRPPKTDLIIEQTLLLEQRLSTGGGWQDQVGGVVGGVKSTTTEATIPQRPVVEQLPLTDSQYEALQERMVVYYSGQQRLARDILRRVMGRWLAREPAIQLLTESLKHGAASLREALLQGRLNTAAKHIDQYWQIKKELYPGSTTPTIDLLFLEMRPYYLAAGLAGAGGGGFAYFLCKNGKQAGHLRQRLAEYSGLPGAAGNVYETQINRTGLTIKTRKT